MMGVLRRRSIWIWLACSGVLGFGLGFVPLFGVLGYELALASALFASIAGLFVGASVAFEIAGAPASVLRANWAGRTIVRSTLAAIALAMAIALPPALISAVRGLWLPTCDWGFGVFAYAAMPLASAALAGAIGHAIGIALGPPRRTGKLRWFARRLAVLSPLLVCAAGAFWRFYGEPPVCIYSAVIGYFPGNLYDENVQLGAPLLWSRVEQLAWVVAILSMVATRLDVPTFRLARLPRPAGRRLLAYALAGLALAGALVLRVQAGALGYAVDADDLQDLLAGRYETAHFIIHYAHTKEIDRDIALIAEDHEFRYQQVVSQLGVAPPDKLHSYWFADSAQKARWFGARNVEMTKPWRREIYLDHRAWPHAALRHEIAHAVASEFGDPIFGVAARYSVLVNPGLVEGLAVAIDWPGPYDRLTPHEAVRALKELGLEPKIGDLLSIRFLTVSSDRSYTTAGSFLKFLLDRYGAAKLRALYRSGGDFAGAYDKSQTALEDEWRAMIDTIVLPKDVVEGTRERFRTGSVFARPCPHAIARRRMKAELAAAQGKRAEAIRLMREVCNDSTDEPRDRIKLGDFLSAGNASQTAEAQGLWTRIAGDPGVTSTLRAQAYERLARSAAFRGELATTIDLIARAAQLPVDPEQRRQLDAETFALHHDGPAGTALRSYFFAAPGIDGPTWALFARLAEPDLGFAHYLAGIQAGVAERWVDSATELDRALALGVPGTAFVKNAARRLVLAAYRTGDLERARHAISVLSGDDMTESDHLLAKDWAARIDFDANRHL